MTKNKKQKKVVRAKLVPRSGCIFTQKDIDEVIGPALFEIAERHKVDVPQLTERDVYDDLQKDRKNPLWAYINVDDERAMKEWMLRQINKLIVSVRYVTADLPHIKPSLIWESIADTSARDTGGSGRARVSVLHAHDNVSMVSRIADEKVTRLRYAFEALRDWCERERVLPKTYKALASGVEAAFVKFDGVMGVDAAAE